MLSGLSRSVATAFREVSQHLYEFDQDGVRIRQAQVPQGIMNLQRVAREVNYTCFCSSERSQNKCLVPSDRPLLTAMFEPGEVDIISENDSKGVSGFDNCGQDSELKCEVFLQEIVTLSKSKQLSQLACKNLFYRKLQSSARALFD